jgi:hypothetical protein
MGVRGTSAIFACAALAASAGLSGCVSTAMGVASFALSGMSYALTDKSPSDNILSAMADSDCELFRFVKDQPICRDDPAPVQMAALGDIAPAAGDMIEPPAPSPYRVYAGSALVVDRLAVRQVELVGFSASEELYALVHDDGALEVFVHDPHAPRGTPNIRLVLHVDRYAVDPDALQAVIFGGTSFRIKDIVV